jgi:hypothetical protein
MTTDELVSGLMGRGFLSERDLVAADQNLAPLTARYDLLEKLGQGTSGVVHKARDRETGQTVAIKILHDKNSSSLERFRREARLLATLGETDGVVPILDAGAAVEGPYIVLAFVEGGTLRGRLRGGPMAIAAVIDVARALAGALARVHEMGVVHRDLKPDNVLFTREGRPLISDLGLAKHFRTDAPGASASVRLTRDGSILGTPCYMAPEQLVDPRAAGPRADIYALGVLLYECLAGEPPFLASTIVDLFARVASGAHDPIEEARPDTPPWLARAVERALSLDPELRPEDARELLRELEAAAPSRRSRGAIFAVSAFVGASVFAAGVLALVLRRGEGGPKAASPLPAAAEVAADTSAPSAAEPERPVVVGPARLAAELPLSCETISVSADGATLLVVQGGAVLLWDRAQRKERAKLHVHGGSAACVAFLGSNRAVTTANDGTVEVWNLATAERVASHADPQIRALAVSEGGTRYATGGADAHVRVFESGRETPFVTTNGIHLLAFARESGLIVVVHRESLELLDPVGARVVKAHSLAPVLPGLKTVVASPDGAALLWEGLDRTLWLVDLRRGDLAVRPLSLDRGVRIHGMSFGRDGRRAAAIMDRSLEVWGVPSGALLGRGALPGDLRTLVFLPGDRALVAGSRLGALYDIDLASE